MRSTQREDMKLRKRIAGICVGVIGIFILVLFFSFSVRTAEKQTYHWEAEEVIEHVDPNGKSEEGFWYAVNDERDAVYIYDYSPTDENSILIEEENEIRIPDKVIFEGEETEYPVTSISINPQGTENLRALPLLTVYIGKDIASIDLDYLFWPMTFEVHPENPHFISENGSLYSKDKKILYRFGDMGYEEGDCFTIPDTVETVRGSAFLQTELQEVVLNEQITEIPNNCFYRSNIQRIHTKEVTTIGERAFSHSEQIKDVYLPKVKQMGNYAFAGCRRLDRVLCGTKESCRFDALSIFENCYRLRTLILPENVSALGEHALAGCISLRILYLPEPLAELGNDSLGVCGELAVYVEGEIPDYYDSNVTFYQAPAHNGQKVTYISSPFWAVEGNYCADCGQGGAFTTEVGDVAPPELSEPADQCPSVLPVNRNLTDTNGVVYQIESRTKTAEVKGIDTSRPFEKNYFAIPEKIEVEGEEYIVERIGNSAFSDLLSNLKREVYLILPDTITAIEKGAFSQGKIDRLIFGKNVERIASAFPENMVDLEGGIETIAVSGDNPYFIVREGVLYNKEQSELYYYSGEAGKEEFTVPNTVHRIGSRAFTKSKVKRIFLPDKSKIDIAEDAFRGCDAQIINLADGGASSTTEPVSTLTPTEIPTVEPVTTVSPSPTAPQTLQTDNKPVATPVPTAISVISLKLSSVRVKEEDGRQVRLTWKTEGKPNSIEIYRSQKRNDGFRKRKQLKGNSVGYVDDSVKNGKKYFYKIKACSISGVQEWSPAYEVQMPEMMTPVIRVKKGKSGNVRFLSVVLKKYSGKYVDIYVNSGKGFKKVKLFSHYIGKYKGKFKIRYTFQNKKLCIRVRTYKKTEKKKIYSTWSKISKLKV